jgi:hypothetical protein
MKKKVNFIVKTYDAKVGEINKALKAAGIEVESVAQLYAEEGEEKKEKKSKG